MSDITDLGTDVTRQENITRILDCAEGLFRHFGYSKTTVADIARELGMSTANIYRFFASKVEIHQAICGRMLENCYQQALQARRMPGSASERLRCYVQGQFQWVADAMLDRGVVHEMVVVAIERDWHVIERHIDSINELVAEIIAEGMASGEFAEQDPVIAAHCFCAATVSLCHPQLVAKSLAKENPLTADDLIDFALRALKK